MELRAAREASGKTQAQVAKEVGIPEQMYQRYEYGKCEPGARIANRIARAVHRTTVELWGFGEGAPDSGKAPGGNPVQRPTGGKDGLV